MKISVLIDGGHLRVLARDAGKPYTPDYIEKVAHACVGEGEIPLRFLYYDCAPYNGTVHLPVSGNQKVYDKSPAWLDDLASRNLFAVRLGVLKFRGFKPKNFPIQSSPVTDSDFKPDFEQKGVDMRIGLDIAAHAAKRSVDRIAVITNDTDCVPAFKLARTDGLQVIIMNFPNTDIATELLRHSDYRRPIVWPD